MQNILASREKSEEKPVIESQDLTLENLETALADDTKVKLAGLDIDGERYAAASIYFPLTSTRHTTGQADIQEEVLLCC